MSLGTLWPVLGRWEGECFVTNEYLPTYVMRIRWNNLVPAQRTLATLMRLAGVGCAGDAVDKMTAERVSTMGPNVVMA